MTVLDELGFGARVLFVHAHPDDESVQSGALTAWAARHADATAVVTCTRGEKGEIVAGSVGDDEDLVAVRQREIDRALRVLGVSEHFWLGTPPAAAGEPRIYRDSGMRWIAPGVAGPDDSSDPETFVAADLPATTADLVALIGHWRPTVIVSYDEFGTYGHPDHVRAYEITAAAADATGTPRFEIASALSVADFEWVDFSELRDVVTGALDCYRTQLTVTGDTITHVGGQTEPIETRVGIRRA